MTKTQASQVWQAKQAWQSARPVDAMKLLASLGCTEMQRRYHLTAWGVSADDAIDFASDSYIAEPCSYTGCRWHYLAAGSARIGEPKVWCADHADLGDLYDD